MSTHLSRFENVSVKVRTIRAEWNTKKPASSMARLAFEPRTTVEISRHGLGIKPGTRYA
jgi:hypothetical protein